MNRPAYCATRVLTILALSIAMGGVLGLIAAIASTLPFPLIATCVGMAIGLFSSIYNVPLLGLTDLRKSISASFICAAAAVWIVSAVADPMHAILVAFSTQVIVAIVAAGVFYRDDTAPHYFCKNCGYDTRGIAADAPCPECGAPRPR